MTAKVKGSSILMIATVLSGLFFCPVRLVAAKEPTGAISGRVIDQETLMPLPGVLVSLEGLNIQAVSGENGQYQLDGVPAGSYTVHFRFTASRPVAYRDIQVKPERVTQLTARFRIEVQTKEELTIQAGLFQDQVEEPAPVSSFSQEEVRRSPSSSGDVARIIATLPSVSQLNDQKNSLIVRGSSPNENLYLIDNIEVPAISHFPFQASGGGAISLINVDFLDQVSFSPGGFSAMFGERMSSISQIRFRDGSRDRFLSQLSLDMVGIGAVAEGPLFCRQSSWMLSFRRSYADLLTKMMETGVTPGWSDLQGKISWDIGDRHRLVVIGIAGWDESDMDGEEARKTGQDYYGLTRDNSATIGINWFAMWGPGAYSDTSLALSRVRYRQDWSWSFDDSAAIANDSLDSGVNLRHQTTLTLSGGHRLRIGAQAQLLHGDYRYRSASALNPLGEPLAAVDSAIDFKAQKAALFADWTLPLPGRASLTLGVRGDYFSSTRSLDGSPRLNLNLPLSRRLNLDLYAGLFRQNLPLLLLTQHEGNRALYSPRCRQLGGGLSWRMDEYNQFTLALYGKFYRHLPVDPSQQDLCLLDEQFNQYRFSSQALEDHGQARAFGLELTWQKKMHHRFYALANLALSRSQYRNADGVWRSRISDRRYLFNLTGGYKLGRTWDLSARWLIAGGVPYTPFDEAASRAANAGIYDLNRINAARLPAYHSLNLTLDKKFFFSASSLTLTCSLWNAYNHDNIAYLFWNRVENRLAQEMQWSLLPVLGVEFEF